MKYRIYLLKFTTPVHFFEADFAGVLENCTMTFSADTYFNALCSEVSRLDKVLLDNIIEQFNNNKLALSSLFPYIFDEALDDLQLYLPKPIMPVDKMSKITSYTAQKEYKQKLKHLKQIEYIRASKLKKWLQTINSLDGDTWENPVFAIKNTETKVACRREESLPYFISNYRFKDNSGLYFILGYEDDVDVERLDQIIENLGYSGIGGKKSSGYGKYKFYDTPWDLEDGFYVDDLILDKMLKVNKGPQLCIAPILPELEALDNIRNWGTYKIIKRSGFIYDVNTHNKVRKNNIYMLGEGSCVNGRPQGQFLTEKYEEISYPIYRNGLGMFVGLNYE